jgi:regulator-associated protein of mTOR
LPPFATATKKVRIAFPKSLRLFDHTILTLFWQNAKGQNACADAGVLRICLHLLPGAASREHGSPLLVRWLCLLMGKLWENVLATTKEAFGCGAPDAVASLLQHPTPDARAAAVYALGALVFVSEDGDDQDVSHDEPGRRGGFGASASTAHGTDDGDKNTNAQFTFGDAERAAAERAVACHILPGVADASPVVRAETAIALGRLACAHSKRFRAAAEWYAALHMSPDYRNNRNNPNTLERRGSREFGGREGTAVMRALDEEGSLSFERGGAAGSAGNGGNGNAGTGPPLPVPHHKRSSPTSPTRDRRAHHNMAAFGSSTSLASLGSTGSLGGLAGSAGRNAGVYAATDAGTYRAFPKS